jgi:hypothetical protein
MESGFGHARDREKEDGWLAQVVGEKLLLNFATETN